jgi:hypothetical protein
MRLHAASAWYPRRSLLTLVVAARVKLHGTSPWHLSTLEAKPGIVNVDFNEEKHLFGD